MGPHPGESVLSPRPPCVSPPAIYFIFDLSCCMILYYTLRCLCLLPCQGQGQCVHSLLCAACVCLLRAACCTAQIDFIIRFSIFNLSLSIESTESNLSRCTVVVCNIKIYTHTVHTMLYRQNVAARYSFSFNISIIKTKHLPEAVSVCRGSVAAARKHRQQRRE